MNALYSLYDALLSIDVPADKAKAVVSAMEQEMSGVLATKSDLQGTQLLLRQELTATRDLLKQEIDGNRVHLEQKLDLLRSSMTIRLGSMLFVGMGMLFAALKLT